MRHFLVVRELRIPTYTYVCRVHEIHETSRFVDEKREPYAPAIVLARSNCHDKRTICKIPRFAGRAPIVRDIVFLLQSSCCIAICASAAAASKQIYRAATTRHCRKSRNLSKIWSTGRFFKSIFWRIASGEFHASFAWNQSICINWQRIHSTIDLSQLTRRNARSRNDRLTVMSSDVTIDRRTSSENCWSVPSAWRTKSYKDD